jgi:FKBP-type peptidyl-prolyl cis-trans isomerase
MKRTSIFIALCSFCIGAMAQNDFTTSPRGLKYKIVSKASAETAKDGDIIKMNITYSTNSDSIIFSTHHGESGPVQFNIGAPQFNGDPMEGFAMLGDGDSAIFLMPADSAYKTSPWPPFAKKGDFIRIYISVIEVMTKEEYDLARKKEMENILNSERATIEGYLAKNNLSAASTPTGLHYIIETQGEGAKAQPGKTVVVNYTGKLLDGKIFDSSLNPGRTPFEFPLGAGRVIKGWDEGIALFNAGGKGTLIIPSTLGYGNRAAGQIPPNSILIFEIEVLEVK